MNRLEIRTEIRRIVAQKTVSQSYCTDQDINAFINEGIQDMCVKAGVYLIPLVLTVPSTGIIGVGTPPYDTPLVSPVTFQSWYLPWNFISYKNGFTPSGATLDLIKVEDAGKNWVTGGAPSSFFITNYPITLQARANLTSYVVWPDTPDYTLTYLVPATGNGYMYECVSTGVSGVGVPTYSTTLGGLTTDGSVVWKTCSLIASLKYLNFTTIPTDYSNGTGTYLIYYTAMDDPLYTDLVAPKFALEKHRHLVQYGAVKFMLEAKQLQLATLFYTEYASALGIPVPSQGLQDQPQAKAV